MPDILFRNENRVVPARPGESVLAASRRGNIVIDSPCNGSGTCGKCRVKIGDKTVLACQTLVGESDIEVETIAHRDVGKLKILAGGTAWEGETDPPALRRGGISVGAAAYGAAVDIGTTTLVASLIDLHSGAEVACASSLNPQARHAQDVLSRITFASTREGLAQMQKEVMEAINSLIAEAAQNSSAALSDIREAVFSGNTTMVYLALGIEPATLGKYPYSLTRRGGEDFPAGEHGLRIASCGTIYVPPLISAYVGADITSGILVTGLEQARGTTLFVDVGTNGEMVLACDGELTATSTAAGPAFEGMNISCGMRAAPGAVERVTLDSGDVAIQTIGGAPPVGICGSGLLDAIGELARCRVIDRNGRLLKSGHRWVDRIATVDGKASFLLVEKTADSPQIGLTQKDIRQVQLAKAAVRAGVELMLARAGLSASAVDRVLIAGSFGFHLREASLLNLGLLPPEFAGKVQFSGNTSQTGAVAFLLNGGTREAMSALTKKIHVIELANAPDFQNVFIQSMGFSQHER